MKPVALLRRIRAFSVGLLVYGVTFLVVWYFLPFILSIARGDGLSREGVSDARGFDGIVYGLIGGFYAVCWLESCKLEQREKEERDSIKRELAEYGAFSLREKSSAPTVAQALTSLDILAEEAQERIRLRQIERERAKFDSTSE